MPCLCLTLRGASCSFVRDVDVVQGSRISNSRIKPKGDVANEAVAGGAAGLA